MGERGETKNKGRKQKPPKGAKMEGKKRESRTKKLLETDTGAVIRKRSRKEKAGSNLFLLSFGFLTKRPHHALLGQSISVQCQSSIAMYISVFACIEVSCSVYECVAVFRES